MVEVFILFSMTVLARYKNVYTYIYIAYKRMYKLYNLFCLPPRILKTISFLQVCNHFKIVQSAKQIFNTSVNNNDSLHF